MGLKEGTSAKVGHNIRYTSRGLHCRNHIAISNFRLTYINSWNKLHNLVDISSAPTTNWGYILKSYKYYFDKFVWKNRRVSKFRGEFPLPFSILMNMISYKNSWSYQSIYAESLKWFWNDMNDSGINSRSLHLPPSPSPTHQGFPQVLRTWGDALQDLMGGGLKSIHGGSMSGALNADEKNPVKEFIW